MAQTRRERRGDAFQEKLARVLDARLDPIGKKLDALARTSDARLERKPARVWHEWLVCLRAFAESACALVIVAYILSYLLVTCVGMTYMVRLVATKLGDEAAMPQSLFALFDGVTKGANATTLLQAMADLNL